MYKPVWDWCSSISLRVLYRRCMHCGLVTVHNAFRNRTASTLWKDVITGIVSVPVSVCDTCRCLAVADYFFILDQLKQYSLMKNNFFTRVLITIFISVISLLCLLSYECRITFWPTGFFAHTLDLG